ncbi:hypothetical protein FPQ18DRAFT_380149 [Pyronema domesticum]|nr:hypothetical protein FPQ18DRAFT_380149 [Pyronema domesticum]
MAERSKAPDSSLSFGVDHHTEHSGLARGGGSNPPLVSFFLFLFYSHSLIPLCMFKQIRNAYIFLDLPYVHPNREFTSNDGSRQAIRRMFLTIIFQTAIEKYSTSDALLYESHPHCPISNREGMGTPFVLSLYTSSPRASQAMWLRGVPAQTHRQRWTSLSA